MKTLSPVLLASFDQAMKVTGVPLKLQMDYRKWLRFYLDFCLKYPHPPRDPASLEPFMQKLALKNQSKGAQEQAAASVTLYYDVICYREDAKTQTKPLDTPTETKARQDSIKKAIPADTQSRVVHDEAPIHNHHQASDLTWANC